MPNLDIEESCGESFVAGVDEAGRGPWAGPVVAAAVILDRNNIPKGINDSKKISKQRRDSLYEEIMRSSIVGIGNIEVERIDDLNILNATMLAMKEALLSLDKKPDIALIDGNRVPEQLPFKSISVIKGDSKSLSIAAASIIAKVTRDRIMQNLDSAFPDYGWSRNSGYGTKQHIDALEKFGPTIHHRTSFAPIKKMLTKRESNG